MPVVIKILHYIPRDVHTKTAPRVLNTYNDASYKQYITDNKQSLFPLNLKQQHLCQRLTVNMNVIYKFAVCCVQTIKITTLLKHKR
jgi:hypothetical protein